MTLPAIAAIAAGGLCALGYLSRIAKALELLLELAAQEVATREGERAERDRLAAELSRSVTDLERRPRR